MKSDVTRVPRSLNPLFAIAISLILLMFNQASRAQTSNAQLSGLVTDTSGAVVAGAEIRAVNTATNVPYGGVSNDSGIYVLSELLPGFYTISVTAQGFGTVTRSGLKLSIGDHLTQNVALKPGTVEESVTVTGGQTLISSDEASTASVLDNEMITELPQLNRNALDLTSTTPSIQGSGPQVDQVGRHIERNSSSWLWTEPVPTEARNCKFRKTFACTGCPDIRRNSIPKSIYGMSCARRNFPIGFSSR